MKTYKPIAASFKTLKVMDVIAPSIAPVTAQSIAAELDMSYDTTMCHIFTLEQAGWIERVGGGYSATLKLGTHWAMKKAQLMGQKQQIERNLKEIGA